jgi:hypothetical protein
MDSDDTQGFIGTLQYMEAIFSRYDLKRQGYLTPSDADLAFPVIKRVLEEFSANSGTTISDSVAKTVFTFMLDKGEVPDTACHKFASEAELVLWMGQRLLPFMSNFKADRLRVMQIFGALGESSMSTSCSGATPDPSSSPSPSPKNPKKMKAVDAADDLLSPVTPDSDSNTVFR